MDLNDHCAQSSAITTSAVENWSLISAFYLKMSHAFAGRSASSTGGSLEKGRVDVTRVKRYWTGRAPEWLEDEEGEAAEKEQKKRETVAPVIISKTADPRLERLSLSDVKKETTIPAHRRTVHSEASSAGATASAIPESKDEENTETIFERRARLRMKLLETRKDEPPLMSDDEEEDEETGSDDDEYGSGSDVADGAARASFHRLAIKPVFVTAEMRETVQERERLEEEEEREWEAQKQRMQQRRQDTREIVSQKIKDEQEAEQNRVEIPKEAADINTDDDAEEEEEEYASWKQRELTRIKRDKEEILISEKYAEEREKLKNMTEEERIAYERLNPKVGFVFKDA